MQNGILYPDLSHIILGIAFEVHKQLGPGFTEDFYEKAYGYELEERGIPYCAQKVIHVAYKGKPLGIYRLDLVVDDKVIVELKAVSQLTDIFKQQLISYLRATGLELGYLINFGSRSVEHVRMANTKKGPVHPGLPR